MAEKKVGFNELSFGLKSLVVFGWFVLGLFVLSFLVGFIEGVLSVL